MLVVVSIQKAIDILALNFYRAFLSPMKNVLSVQFLKR